MPAGELCFVTVTIWQFCDGIRICLNNFNSTKIRNNMIHNHTGHTLVQTALMTKSPVKIYYFTIDLIMQRCKPAVLFNNKIFNNDLSYENISKVIISSGTSCHYCQKQQAKHTVQIVGKCFTAIQCVGKRESKATNSFVKVFKRIIHSD